MNETPTVNEYIIGFRQWNIDIKTGELRPLYTANSNNQWKKGINKAACYSCLSDEVNTDHEAPDPNCGCGFNAYHSLEKPHSRVFASADNIDLYGAIKAWGKIESHFEGFRSEYAEIIALAYPPKMGVLEKIMVDFVAKKYGVPVVPHDQLEVFAFEHGTKIDESLIPDQEIADNGYSMMVAKNTTIPWKSVSFASVSWGMVAPTPTIFAADLNTLHNDPTIEKLIIKDDDGAIAYIKNRWHQMKEWVKQGE